MGSTGVLKTLQDRELIDVVGRGEGIGRPVLYGTTSRFLEHFGFASLEDLPRPEELPVILRERIPLGPEDDDEAEAGGGVEAATGSAGEESPAPRARRARDGRWLRGRSGGTSRPGPPCQLIDEGG